MFQRRSWQGFDSWNLWMQQSAGGYAGDLCPTLPPATPPVPSGLKHYDQGSMARMELCSCGFPCAMLVLELPHPRGWEHWSTVKYTFILASPSLFSGPLEKSIGCEDWQCTPAPTALPYPDLLGFCPCGVGMIWPHFNFTVQDMSRLKWITTWGKISGSLHGLKAAITFQELVVE